MLGVVESMVAGAPNAVPTLVVGALPVQLCVAIGRVCGYILSCLNAEYRNVAASAFCEAVGSEVKRELAALVLLRPQGQAERQLGKGPSQQPEGQAQRAFSGHARHSIRRTPAELVCFYQRQRVSQGLIC